MEHLDLGLEKNLDLTSPGLELEKDPDLSSLDYHLESGLDLEIEKTSDLGMEKDYVTSLDFQLEKDPDLDNSDLDNSDVDNSDLELEMGTDQGFGRIEMKEIGLDWTNLN